MIDSEGYRHNVGIIIANQQADLLLCRRRGKKHAWQFPQGGIQQNETPKEALYRELLEELGLEPEDVGLVAESKIWIKYQLPKQYRRYYSLPLCIGQKQKWFFLKLLSSTEKIRLNYSNKPEFDRWKWVKYWDPLQSVIYFKREAYQVALQEFSIYLEQKDFD